VHKRWAVSFAASLTASALHAQNYSENTLKIMLNITGSNSESRRLNCPERITLKTTEKNPAIVDCTDGTREKLNVLLTSRSDPSTL
jgi:hypothetical protein